MDDELASLLEEREHNLRRLNHKRLQHVTTLQQLGLLDETLSSMEDIAAISSQQQPFEAAAAAAATTSSTASNDRWKSEIDIYLVPETLGKPKGAGPPPVTVHVNNSDEHLTKCVSGSDPALGSFPAGHNSSLAGTAAAKSCCDVSTVPNGSPATPVGGSTSKASMFNKHSTSQVVAT